MRRVVGLVCLAAMFLCGAALIPASCNPPPPAFSLNCAGAAHGTITLSDLVGVEIRNCHFEPNAFVQLTRITNAVVDNNTFTADGSVQGAALYLDTQGSNNHFTNNQVYGAGAAVGCCFVGFDDGVVEQNSTGALISANTIDAVWDCGIETVGSLTSSAIVSNTITNARTCAIGGWYDLAFQSNQVTSNTVHSSGLTFRFFWQPNTQTVGYFTANTFTGNVASAMTGTAQNSIFDVGAPVTESGNHFGTNDFAHAEQFAPQFTPNDTSWVNDGGNLCGTRSQSGGSVVCPG